MGNNEREKVHQEVKELRAMFQRFLDEEWAVHKEEMRPISDAYNTINNSRKFILWMGGGVAAIGSMVIFGKKFIVFLASLIIR